ncbi:MAG TPA: hypothetical protein VGP72_08060 [Planctomycetota bacterium]
MNTSVRRLLLSWLGVLAMICGSLTAGEPQKFQAYALIVAGEGSEPNFSENYRDWVVRLHKLLTTDCGISAGNVRVLMEKKELAPEIVSDVSTKANVIKTFGDLKTKVKPGDQFLLVFIGHGTAQSKTGKLCLPGPDLTSDETAELLRQLPNREVVFINSACASYSFVDKCSLPGRVIITATNSSAEGNETYFMEFLLKAFENRAADADKNGTVDLLEAFNYAATECPKWYLRQYLEDTGWRIEGKQSRQLWQKFYGNVKDKAMADPLDANAEDAEPQLGEWGPHWQGRRMPAEHAQLDDNGDRQGSAVFANNQFTPLAGSEEKADGFHARKVILGKPQGNTEPPPAPLEKAEKNP